MEQEFDSTKHENKVDDSREGYQRPSYTKEYSSEGRPQRQRIRTPIRSAYPSDRQRYNSDREAGSFRPEGFGGGLAADGDHRQQYPQRPRYNNNYGERQQGYRPRYNNDGEGYSPRQQQGYRPRYNNNSEGNGQQGGGYNRGGYNQQRGGYGQQGGGYNRGGYGQQRGGYGQQGGGYNRRQRTPDYDPNAKYSLKKRIEYSEANIDPNAPIRLNKYLANAGVCSRREADDFIQAGLVSVNGQVVTELGTKVLRSDNVVFHDQPVTIEKKVYVLLNKPKDYVTTSDDPQQRKTVMDLVKDA